MVVGPGGSGGSGGSQHGKRRGNRSTRATESSTRHESGDEQEGDNDEEDAMKTSIVKYNSYFVDVLK